MRLWCEVRCQGVGDAIPLHARLTHPVGKRQQWITAGLAHAGKPGGGWRAQHGDVFEPQAGDRAPECGEEIAAHRAVGERQQLHGVALCIAPLCRVNQPDPSGKKIRTGYAPMRTEFNPKDPLTKSCNRLAVAAAHPHQRL